ncbi:unnamed protein product, partial [marine sediment metagenome]
ALDRLGLKPTGETYGMNTELHSWKYYKSPEYIMILRENVDGTFLVRACVRELRREVS